MEDVPHWKKSEMLSDDLDEVGFSRKRVQERQLLYERNSSKRYPGFDDTEYILAGSLREGVGFLFYNDIDILEIDHTIICETNVTREPVQGKTVLQIDENGATPGYCKLNIVSISDTSINALYMNRWIKNLPLPNSLFSQVRVLKMPLMSELKYFPVQGPSVPAECHLITNNFGIFDSIWSNMNFKSDHVLAFPCKVDHILQEWKSRQRSGWPDAKIISKVMTLPTYVVPVGVKNDDEWRISFVMAEIHLVHSFNDTQTKVYVLMKVITKHTLKPLCKDITSYVVKNVMFWVCEKVPTEMFKPNLLIHRLRDALKFLRSAVEQRNLPNYMIPKRNLFEGKLNCDEKTEKMIDMLNKWVEYTSSNFYKQNFLPRCINQEASTLQSFNFINSFLTRFNYISWLNISFFNCSLHHIYYQCLITSKETDKGSRDLKKYVYENGPINMVSPCPYLLIFFLLIPMRLFLMSLLPQVEIFISDNKYLVWTLFICYLGFFCFIQHLKVCSRKFKMIDFFLFKRVIIYTPKSVQRLEEMILSIFIPSFTVTLGFTELTAGINLPFMCLCFGLVLLSYQIQKFGNQFEVMIPGAYINRIFQMRVLFPLLFAITIYVLW